MEAIVKSSVLLKPLSQSHTYDLHQLIESNRDYLKEWLPWLDNITVLSDTASFIESVSASGLEVRAGLGLEEESVERLGLNEKLDHAPHFGVFFKGELCGVAGFHEIQPQSKVGAIGYWLAQAYTGQGIISTAVKELIEIGFNELKLQKIEIRCAEKNIKSRAIAERLGFTYETTIPEGEWLYDKYVDQVVYLKCLEE